MRYEDIIKMSDEEFINEFYESSHSKKGIHKNNVVKIKFYSTYYYEADDVKLFLSNKRFNKILRRKIYLDKKHEILINIVAEYLKEFNENWHYKNDIGEVLNKYIRLNCDVFLYKNYKDDTKKVGLTTHRRLSIKIYDAIQEERTYIYDEIQNILNRLYCRDNDLIISKFEKRKINRLLKNNNDKSKRKRL